jgi:hypothetical protein
MSAPTIPRIIDDKSIFSEIANIAGLTFGLNIEHCQTYLRKKSQIRKLVIMLSELRHSPPSSVWRDFFPDASNYLGELLDRPESDNPPANAGIDIPAEITRFRIFDVLGQYFPRERRIVIYDKMCDLVASQLKVDNEWLRYLVTIHEIAHAVTHLGGDIFTLDPSWKNFDRADKSDKESLAQAYTFFFLKKRNNLEALRVFKEINKFQSARYRGWEKFENEGLGALNAELRKKRLLSKQVSTLVEIGSHGNYGMLTSES